MAYILLSSNIATGYNILLYNIYLIYLLSSAAQGPACMLCVKVKMLLPTSVMVRQTNTYRYIIYHNYDSINFGNIK